MTDKPTIKNQAYIAALTSPEQPTVCGNKIITHIVWEGKRYSVSITMKNGDQAVDFTQADDLQALLDYRVPTLTRAVFQACKKNRVDLKDPLKATINAQNLLTTSSQASPEDSVITMSDSDLKDVKAFQETSFRTPNHQLQTSSEQVAATTVATQRLAKNWFRSSPHIIELKIFASKDSKYQHLSVSALQRLTEIGDAVKSSPQERHFLHINPSDLSISHTQESARFTQKAKRFKPAHADSLKELRTIFATVFNEASRSDDPIVYYNTYINPAIEALKKLYTYYETQSSARFLGYQNDILESMAIAIKKAEELKTTQPAFPAVTRIQATFARIGKTKVQRHHTPLIRTEDLEEVDALCQRFAGQNLTIEEMCQKEPRLRELLVRETVTAGKLVELLYRHKALTPLRSFGEQQMTTRAKKYKKRLPPQNPKTLKKVLKFFHKLGISPATTIKDELYAYSETFTQDLRAETSLDGAFRRTLRPEISAMLLSDAEKLREEVKAAVGPHGNVVISDSFCRLRVIDIARGNIRKKYDITHKVLNNTEENADAIDHETEDGGSFSFSVQNMLGWENDVDTAFGIEEGQAHIANDEIWNISIVQQLYRRCLVNAINRKDSWLAIQRLAPADYHHFVETVGGKVLSLTEACAVLQAMLDKKIRSYPDNAPQDLTQELTQLNVLIGKLKEIKTQEGEGYQEPAAVEIQGTLHSVSTIATKAKMSPLSQNDRKTIVVQHDDGTLSIHTFIGAVGVNDVDISETHASERKTAGIDYGVMGFGHDTKRQDRDRIAGAAEHQKLRERARTVIAPQRSPAADSSIDIAATPGLTRFGEPIAKIDKKGSTVVSLYFKDSLVPTNLITKGSHIQYKEKGSLFTWAKNNRTRTMEIQATLGDVIGVSTSYAALRSILDNPTNIPIQIDLSKTFIEQAEETLDQILPLEEKQIKDLSYAHVLREVQTALRLTKEKRSTEQQDLITTLTNNLANYIQKEWGSD